MKTTNETLPTRLPATATSPSAVSRALPRYRTRDFGVGYGASSGYASNRRYAGDRADFAPRFR